MDLHKRESQLCILGADGTVAEQRIVASRERFTAVFGTRPPARILLEASTESEWVAQCLEALGHEVIVGDAASDKRGDLWGVSKAPHAKWPFPA